MRHEPEDSDGAIDDLAVRVRRLVLEIERQKAELAASDSPLSADKMDKGNRLLGQTAAAARRLLACLDEKSSR